MTEIDTPELRFRYTNWRGETGDRRVRPHGIWFTTSKYHGDEPQWFLYATDLDKSERRMFAMKDIETIFGTGAMPATSMPLEERRHDREGVSREELCTLFAEEAAEAITEAMKCLRFGWARRRGDHPRNFMLLAAEIGDVLGVIDAMLPYMLQQGRETIEHRRADKIEHYKRLRAEKRAEDTAALESSDI